MRRPWFTIPGLQDGDRRLADQLKGLERLRDSLPGANVLDLGCAEGLISMWCWERGANKVHGIDVAHDFIATAQRMAERIRGDGAWISFAHGDIARPLEAQLSRLQRWDIVLALAVLHKIPRPADAIASIVRLQPRLVVVRLPGDTGPVIAGERQAGVATDVREHFRGYRLAHEDRGHFDEWVGYFETLA